jgi:hypothetical protein
VQKVFTGFFRLGGFYCKFYCLFDVVFWFPADVGYFFDRYASYFDATFPLSSVINSVGEVESDFLKASFLNNYFSYSSD